ncbi:hypothetical protein QZH45_21090 [Pseudomonas corrugata]|jgi:NTE family protein|uniref:hypothetical protein n=1 Tax=Pseudomonas corrugata TaxID=47879 RepID=UPI003D81A310
MGTQRGLNDRLLKGGRLAIEGVSATSAGAMNAFVLAYGMLQADEAGARQALLDFWYAVTQSVERHNPLRWMPWLKGTHSFSLDYTLMWKPGRFIGPWGAEAELLSIL